jgi:hypothetical protein
VEGAQRPTQLDDSHDDTLQIPQHLARRNAEHGEATLHQSCIARGVPFRAVAPLVGLAVDFYGEPRLETGKVDNEGCLWELFAEFEVTGPFAKFPPEQDFGKAHFFSQTAGVFDRLDGALEDSRAPSTSLRLVPLPVPGRI